MELLMQTDSQPKFCAICKSPCAFLDTNYLHKYIEHLAYYIDELLDKVALLEALVLSPAQKFQIEKLVKKNLEIIKMKLDPTNM